MRCTVLLPKHAAQLANWPSLAAPSSLSDFATRQSPFNLLRQLKVDRMKIDRSFISQIDIDSNQRDMMEAILMTAKRLKLATLKEDVGTSA